VLFEVRFDLEKRGEQAYLKLCHTLVTVVFVAKQRMGKFVVQVGQVEKLAALTQRNAEQVESEIVLEYDDDNPLTTGGSSG
jgi:hypothetical protein